MSPKNGDRVKIDPTYPTWSGSASSSRELDKRGTVVGRDRHFVLVWWDWSEAPTEVSPELLLILDRPKRQRTR